MSVNKHKPHVYILPEDDANRQIANGFRLGVDSHSARQLFVLPVAGGWIKVLENFKQDHRFEMMRFPDRLMILLIDLDGNEQRLFDVKKDVPGELIDRVFFLSTLTKPEDLKPHFGHLELIGTNLAQDCRDNTDGVWSHKLLKHNQTELDRLRECVRPILFG